MEDKSKQKMELNFNKPDLCVDIKALQLFFIMSYQIAVTLSYLKMVFP